VLFVLVGLIVVPQQLMLESFKRQSTYILDDDLENILSPWTIFDVEGWRLFTKLSNLTGSTEELMNNNSDNSFMIGALLPELFSGLRTSIFWSTLKYTTPDDISIDPLGLGSVDGYGSVFGIWNQFVDVNNDGNYDIHNYCTEHAAGFYDELWTSTNFGLSYDLGASIVGFNYIRYKMWGKDNSFDTLDLYVYDLYPNFVETLNAVRHGDQYYDFISDNPENIYAISFLLKDLAGYRTGVTIGADFYKELADQRDFLNSITDLAPNHQNYQNREEGNLSDYYQWVNPVTQFIVRLNSLKKYEGNLNEIGLNFYYGMGGNYARERANNHYEKYLTGVMDFTERSIYDAYSVDSARLSYNEMGGGFFGRIVRKLGENVEFGIGLDVSTSQNAMTYDGTYNEHSNETYNDGDHEVLDADDYTTTEGYTVTYKIEETHAWTTFRVPVGVEITITQKKNWFIRFGANPRKMLHSSTEKFELVDYTNNIEKTITGAGDTTITITEPDLPVEYKTAEYIEDQTCDFSYGLGWHPNNNISIDFITMFNPTGTILDLDWIRSWKISTTIKFF